MTMVNSKCRRGHDLSLLGRNKYGACIACVRITNSRWKRDNPDLMTKYRHDSYIRHRDKRLSGERLRRLCNPDHFKSLELKKLYGITLEEKRNMLVLQGGRCAACGSTEPGGRCNEWHVDHDHGTNKIRGILCSACNLSLGWAKESASRLRSLADYIEVHTKEKGK